MVRWWVKRGARALKAFVRDCERNLDPEPDRSKGLNVTCHGSPAGLCSSLLRMAARAVLLRNMAMGIDFSICCQEKVWRCTSMKLLKNIATGLDFSCLFPKKICLAPNFRNIYIYISIFCTVCISYIFMYIYIYMYWCLFKNIFSIYHVYILTRWPVMEFSTYIAITAWGWWRMNAGHIQLFVFDAFECTYPKATRNDYIIILRLIVIIQWTHISIFQNMYKSIGMISSEISQAPKREPHSPNEAVCFVEPYCSAPVSCNQSVVVGRADAARYRPLPLNDFIHVTACMYIFTWSISNFIYAYIYI